MLQTPAAPGFKLGNGESCTKNCEGGSCHSVTQWIFRALGLWSRNLVTCVIRMDSKSYH